MIQSIKEGRKEDGYRSIADKILKRLKELEKTSDKNAGRWAWELLQNAKDSVAESAEGNLSIRLSFDENFVEFSHNGMHFTEKDIRGLINQISSKEVEEGELTKKTGRFGTGFLTTHLLSKIVQIKGIVKTLNNEYYRFGFLLDRQGNTTTQLITKIEKSWDEFDESVEKISSYNSDEYNTSFEYHLSTEYERKVAEIGTEEFSKLIPFVLAFVPRIHKVEIHDKTTHKLTIFEKEVEQFDHSILSIVKTENEDKSRSLILYSANDKIMIATEIEKTEKGYSTKCIKQIPKLFCDFPLIGSENFNFPIVVNSFFFNPLTERNGIWLKDSKHVEVKENQALIENAVELFNSLISEIEERKFFDLYNLADSKMPNISEDYFDSKWYKDRVQTPIREVLFKAKIVELETAHVEKLAIEDLWFPKKSDAPKIQEKIWQFAFDLNPKIVCKKLHFPDWCDLCWENCKFMDYKVLVKTIAEIQDINKLMQRLNRDEELTFEWLNSFCKFVLEDEKNLSLFMENQITPNQNRILKKQDTLFIDEINDSDLILILKLLGYDWKNILLHKSVFFGKYPKKEKKDIALKITEILNRDSHLSEDFKRAIILLSQWFNNNQSSGKELFQELYVKRAELFMNTISDLDKENLYSIMQTSSNLPELAKFAKILEEDPQLIANIRMGQDLVELLRQFNASNTSELKEILLQAQSSKGNVPKVEITQDLLLSLGITSIQELEKALADTDMSELFHVSNPSAYNFFHVHGLIERAKNNVIDHLKTQEEYDCSVIESVATTVIGGIRKNNLEVNIVVRPSDNGEVIIYYSSEKDTLDYTNAELWIDNGIDNPKHLTLGRILKVTGINRIPI